MIRFPPKKILVPFDFSSLSEAAWTRAVAWARLFGSSLEVVHVEEWPLAAEMAPMPPPSPSREERAKVTARIRETVGSAARITFVVGDPALGILRRARASRADLIVMGTHGRSGVPRAFLGSVAESVARQSPVPVLTVRGGAGDIRSLLAPVNFTGYSYYGFAYAAAAASALRVPLTALHVHVDPIWNGNPMRKLQRLLAMLPPELRRTCRLEVETREKNATRGILDAAAKHDLVVLVAHEKFPVREMILGTTAERVLRGSTGCALIVPAPVGPLRISKDLPEACCASR